MSDHDHRRRSTASSSTARARWKILAEALRGPGRASPVNGDRQLEDGRLHDELSRGKSDTISAVSLGDPHNASKRRFGSFDVLRRKVVRREGAEWTCFDIPTERAKTRPYSSSMDTPPVSVSQVANHILVRYCSPSTFSDITGFDNTGNVCLWPSEEILAYYCVANNMFLNQTVCELGGGMTCLAGNLLAASVAVEDMVLTDGNTKSVDNCADILKVNKDCGVYAARNISVRKLRWDVLEDWSDLRGRFDWIVAADCLFVERYREPLIRCMDGILKRSGTALLLAPRRGDSMSEFVRLASSVFDVACTEKYDDHIWNLHEKNCASNSEYDPDLHYPLLLRLTTKSNS